MAVVTISGKQYLVGVGDKIIVAPLAQKEGEMFEVQDEISKDKVKLKILGKALGPRVRLVKFKPKKGYKRVFSKKYPVMILEVVATGKENNINGKN